jgi:hypothetical protein
MLAAVAQGCPNIQALRVWCDRDSLEPLQSLARLARLHLVLMGSGELDLGPLTGLRALDIGSRDFGADLLVALPPMLERLDVGSFREARVRTCPDSLRVLHVSSNEFFCGPNPVTDLYHRVKTNGGHRIERAGLRDMIQEFPCLQRVIVSRGCSKLARLAQCGLTARHEDCLEPVFPSLRSRSDKFE